jgi:hypothetical protein
VTGGPYVPGAQDDPGRFDGVTDVCATFTLVEYEHESGRLRENSTGLVLGPTDTRLRSLGVYPSVLRGTRYHAAHARAGDFRPGRRVTLSPERYNEWDNNAIAVLDETGTYLAAYVNKQTARTVIGLMHGGSAFRGLSIRGTGAGLEATGMTILMAKPEIIEGLHAARQTIA